MHAILLQQEFPCRALDGRKIGKADISAGLKWTRQEGTPIDCVPSASPVNTPITTVIRRADMIDKLTIEAVQGQWSYQDASDLVRAVNAYGKGGQGAGLEVY
jgi:hypothetical protein